MGWFSTFFGFSQLTPIHKRVEASEATLRQFLTVDVPSGYGTPDDLRAQFVRLVGTRADAARWDHELEASLAAQAAREHTWSALTHNDRIDLAFADLNESGIIALQDAGYTMSDGWEDIGNAADETPNARGGAFFHRQDVERAMSGEGLFIAFGSFDNGPWHASLSVMIAQEICDTLARHGVSARWSGDVDSRIATEPFEWKKRRVSVIPHR